MRFKNCLLFLLLVVVVGCQPGDQTSGLTEPSSVTRVSDQIVEVSCGECQLGLPGEGCDLAVRIDGNSYYVDGSSLDDHGDAHGPDGMCNCIRQARVSGEIVEGRFVATSLKLLPVNRELQANQVQNPKQSRLGATFVMKGKTELFVKDIWEEGPSAMAGLKQGDHILTINGAPVSGLDRESLKSILGETSPLVFQVKRGTDSLEIKVDLP